MGEVKIKSGNLFYGELEQGSFGPAAGQEYPTNTRVRTKKNGVLLDKGTYTVTCIGSTGGMGVYAYTTELLYVKDDSVTNWTSLPLTFTLSETRLVRFVFRKTKDAAISPSDISDIQLLEGTYTSETIPEYQPYFLNRPAHKFTNGQWVDIPTHHYVNGRWQGELTSQNPLKFRADGEMLDWRIEGKTSGNLYPIEMKDDAWTAFRGGKIIPRSDNVLQVLTTDSEQTSGIYTNPLSSALRQLSALSDIVSMSADICCDNPNAKLSIGFETEGKLLYLTQITSDFQHYEVTNFTFSKEQNFVVYCANKQTANIYIKNLMINLGSTALPYEPYGGVGDWDETAQRYKIPVRVEGENLYAIPIGEDLWGDNVSASHRNNNGELIVVMGTGNDSGVYARAGSTIGAKHNEVSNGSWSVEIKADSPMNLRIGFQADGAKYIDITTEYQKFAFDNQSFTYGSTFIIYNRTGVTNTVYLKNFEIYFDNTVNLFTDHQLMEGDSIDYTTDQTSIPIATGNNILTVDTAVQPSKVFVKFEG